MRSFRPTTRLIIIIIRGMGDALQYGPLCNLPKYKQVNLGGIYIAPSCGVHAKISRRVRVCSPLPKLKWPIKVLFVQDSKHA